MPSGPSFSAMSSSSTASEAWASTKSWGGQESDEPLVRRDKYGRKIVEPPKPSSTGKVPEFAPVAGLKGLAKKVVKVGDGKRGVPSPGARVTVHAVGRLPVNKDGGRITDPNDGVKFYSTKECLVSPDAHITAREMNATVASGPQTFVLGAGSVLPAWDHVVPTMLVGEVCEIIVAPDFAYGDEGAEHLGVPPKMIVTFTLELLDWKEARAARETLADPERFATATELKFRGTEMFKKGEWAVARELYDDAAYYLSDAFLGSEVAKTLTSVEHPDNQLTAHRAFDDDGRALPPPTRFGEQNEEAKTMLLACYLNGAQCALKSEEWRAAESRASMALALEPKNLKGLFRRGTARTRLGDYGDAKGDLRRACELDPKSREIRDMFDECKIAESAEKQAQADFYAKTRVADGGYVPPKPDEPEKPFIC